MKSIEKPSDSGLRPRPSSVRLSKPHALTALAAVLNELGKTGLLVTWTNNDECAALVFSIGGARMDANGAKLRIVERDRGKPNLSDTQQ